LGPTVLRLPHGGLDFVERDIADRVAEYVHRASVKVAMSVVVVVPVMVEEVVEGGRCRRVSWRGRLGVWETCQVVGPTVPIHLLLALIPFQTP